MSAQCVHILFRRGASGTFSSFNLNLPLSNLSPLDIMDSHISFALLYCINLIYVYDRYKMIRVTVERSMLQSTHLFDYNLMKTLGNYSSYWQKMCYLTQTVKDDENFLEKVGNVTYGQAKAKRPLIFLHMCMVQNGILVLYSKGIINMVKGR